MSESLYQTRDHALYKQDSRAKWQLDGCHFESCTRVSTNQSIPYKKGQEEQTTSKRRRMYKLFRRETYLSWTKLALNVRAYTYTLSLHLPGESPARLKECKNMDGFLVLQKMKVKDIWHCTLFCWCCCCWEMSFASIPRKKLHIFFKLLCSPVSGCMCCNVCAF